MKLNKLSTIVVLVLFASASTSCLKNKITPANNVTENPIFGFETTKLCEVNLDLALNNYSIIAELYSVNPLNKNGEKIDGIQPILRSITDNKGVVSDVLILENGVKTVYFYTEYIGLQNLIEIPVIDNKINFSVNSPVKSATRSAFAATTRGVVPSDIKTLGGWDNSGIPDYLSPRKNLPENLFYDILSVIPNSLSVESGALQYLGKGNRTELEITAKTPINLMFVNESASMRNSICYYHYPTGKKPENVNDVKLIVAFPDFSFPNYTNGGVTKGLSSGDNIQLKYWNEEAGRFENEFPAGTTLALAIMASSFNTSNGNITKGTIYYANTDFNTDEAPENREHIILMHEKKSDSFIHLFEDRPRTGNVKPNFYPGGNFHDAIINITPEVKGSISITDIPELPKGGKSEPLESSTSYFGTLIFEDLWPEEGDYDMNDIVLEYTSTVYRNKNNRVVKIDDTYELMNIGGQRKCGFGYQLGNSTTSIGSVSVTPASDVVMDQKGLEYGQNGNTPSVMLFGDIKTQHVGQKYVVKTIFSSPVESKDVLPPYNPFITISSRDKELHLINHKPTSLANLNYLGKSYDVSDIEKGIYYVSKNQEYPFALKLPIKGFGIPAEGKRIDATYPKFNGWVNSKGEDNTDWYNK